MRAELSFIHPDFPVVTCVETHCNAHMRQHEYTSSSFISIGSVFENVADILQ